MTTVITERKQHAATIAERDRLAAALASITAQLPAAEMELAEALELFEAANAAWADAHHAAVKNEDEWREYPRPGTSAGLADQLADARAAWMLASADLVGPRSTVNALLWQRSQGAARLEYLEGQIALTDRRIAARAATPPTGGESLLSRIKQGLRGAVAPAAEKPKRSDAENRELQLIRSRLDVPE
jgi:hypothetical protein